MRRERPRPAEPGVTYRGRVSGSLTPHPLVLTVCDADTTARAAQTAAPHERDKLLAGNDIARCVSHTRSCGLQTRGEHLAAKGGTLSALLRSPAANRPISGSPLFLNLQRRGDHRRAVMTRALRKYPAGPYVRRVEDRDRGVSDPCSVQDFFSAFRSEGGSLTPRSSSTTSCDALDQVSRGRGRRAAASVRTPCGSRLSAATRSAVDEATWRQRHRETWLPQEPKAPDPFGPPPRGSR